jgi:PAS domain-containing protein
VKHLTQLQRALEQSAELGLGRAGPQGRDAALPVHELPAALVRDILCSHQRAAALRERARVGESLQSVLAANRAQSQIKEQPAEHEHASQALSRQTLLALAPMVMHGVDEGASGACLCDVRGTVLHATPGFSVLTGFSREQSAGAHFLSLLCSAESDQDDLTALSHAMAVGHKVNTCVYGTRADGRDVWLQLHLEPAAVAAAALGAEALGCSLFCVDDVSQSMEALIAAGAAEEAADSAVYDELEAVAARQARMAAKVAAAIRRAEKKLDATIATRSRAGGGHRRGARRRSGGRAAVEAAGAPWADIEVVPDARDCSPPRLDGMLVRLQRIGLVRGWERAPSGALHVAVQAEALCSRAAASSRAVALEGGGGACAAPIAERGWGFWWPRLRAALDVVDEEAVAEWSEAAEEGAGRDLSALCGAEHPWPVLAMSAALEHATGFEQHEAAGRSVAMFLGASDWPAVVRGMTALVGAGSGVEQRFEVDVVCKDGSKLRSMVALGPEKGEEEAGEAGGAAAPAQIVAVHFSPVAPGARR